MLAKRLLLVDELKAGRLSRLDDTVISLDSTLYFVCRKEDQPSEPIRSLKNWLFSLAFIVSRVVKALRFDAQETARDTWRESLLNKYMEELRLNRMPIRSFERLSSYSR